MSYNADRAMSVGQTEDLVTMAVDSLKQWCLDNVDRFAVMQTIAEGLDKANREVVNGNAAVKLQVLNNSLSQVYNVLENAGVDTEEVVTRDLAEIIAKLQSTHEVCILDKDGNKWSAGQWQIYVEEHGTEPSTSAVVAVITPYTSFVIPQTPAVSRTWGTYNKEVNSEAGLYAAQTGSFVNVLKENIRFAAYENTKRLLLAYHPINEDGTPVLPTIQYDPALPTDTYKDYLCVRFATYAEMVDSGIHVPYDQQTYVVDSDENTPDADGNPTPRVNYRSDGGVYRKRFQVPYVDTQKIVGCPAAKYCWEYKAWDGDTRQWVLPTINHLLIMYAYCSKINECLYALNRSPLPSNYTWACEQNGSANAYCVTLSSGQANSNGGKNASCAVVPVAAL